MVCNQVGGRGVKTTGTLIHAVFYSKYIDLNLECKSQNGLVYVFAIIQNDFQSFVRLQDETGSPSSWIMEQRRSYDTFRSTVCSPCGSGHGTVYLKSAPAAFILLICVLLSYHLCARTFTRP